MKKIIIMLIALSAIEVFSQPWMEKFQNRDSLNFFEIEKEFEAYWKGKDLKEKGIGWKPFKRNLEFWRKRINPDGSFPNNNFNIDVSRVEKNKSNSLSNTSASWSSIGPINSASGYGGIGRVNCVRTDLQNGNIWVGSASGGAWLSTNGGDTWVCKTDFIPSLNSLGVTDIAIHPTNSNIIYIATGDAFATTTRSIGVWKSTDGGNTWAATGLTFTVNSYRTIGRLLIHPSNANILLAATSVGVYRTVNGGTTWTTQSSHNVKDMEFKPNDPNTVYASNSAFYRSTDNGVTWNQVTSGLPSTNVQRIVIGVTPHNSSYVYLNISSSQNSGFLGLYRSVNSGATFTTRSTSPNIMGYEKNGSSSNGQGWYDNCIAVNPINAEEVYVGGINIWKSTNGGTNWSNVTFWYNDGSQTPTVHADQHDLFFDNSTSTMYVGNDGGMYYTTDGGTTFIDKSNGLRITQFYRMSASQITPAIIIAGAQDNGTKQLKAGVWTDELGGDGMDCIVQPNNSSILYGSIQYGDIHKSTNGGNNWRKINDANNNGEYDDINETGNWVTPIVLDPNNMNNVFVGMNNLWKSTNGGTNFTKLTNLPTSSPRLDLIAIAKANSNYIYYTTGNDFYMSTNGGTSFQSLTKPGSSNITYILVDEFNPGKVWLTLAGYNNGDKVYLSIDSCKTWTNISSGIPNTIVNCIYKTDLALNPIFAGTDIGVYRYNDASGVWFEFNQGMPWVIVNELEQQRPSNKLIAATYGRGVFEIDLNVVANILQVPTLIWPLSPDIGRITDTLKISWNAVPGAEFYDIQVSQLADFSTLEYAQTNYIPTEYTIADIDTGKVHYWRVRAKRGSDFTAWSEVRTFTTKLQFPQILTPVKNSQKNPVTGLVTFNPVENATSHFFRITEKNTINSTTYTLSTSSSFSYANLKEGTTYNVTGYGIIQTFPGFISPDREFTTILNRVNPISPSNSRRAIDTNAVQFSWSSNTFANRYRFELASDSLFSNIIAVDSTLTSNSFTSGTLNPISTYYWRVKAYSQATESDWSATFRFSTVLRMAELILPSDNTNQSIKPLGFTWTTVPNATNYHLQINRDSTFNSSGLVLNSATFTQGSYLLNRLNFDTKYFWRVRAINGLDSSAWTPTRSFVTNMPFVRLISPANGETNVLTTGKLVWSKAKEGAKYKIYLTDSSSLDVSKMINTNSTDTTYSFVNIENNKKYYWGVLAYTDINQSDTVPLNSFSTPSNRPILLEPVNRARKLALGEITLKWTSVTNAVQYQLLVDNCNGTTITSLNTSDNQAKIVAGNMGEQFCWKVRVNVNGSWSEWSETYKFNTLLPNINNLKPSDTSAANLVSVKPSLNWKGDKIFNKYQIYVDTDSNFLKKTTFLSLLDTFKIDLIRLTPLTTYYWKVRGISPIDTGDWSTVSIFKTDLPALNLISPENAKMNINVSPTLTWEKTDLFDTQTLIVAEDSLFTKLAYNQVQTSNSQKLNIKLKPLTKYYWKVVGAYDETLVKRTAGYWVFTTDDGLSVEQNEAYKFEVMPNPSKGEINVLCGFNEFENKALKLYNNLGELLLEQPVLSQKFELNLSNYANGRYFILITDNKGNNYLKQIEIQK